MKTEKFYHCFPRISRHHRRETDRYTLGIETLRSIMSRGILLTPERLIIPSNPDSDIVSPPSTEIIQYRACFTFAQVCQLLVDKKHFSQFGNFAIGLDPKRARGLGIVPTTYYYRRSNDETRTRNDHGIDGGLSEEFLFRLAEIRRILIVLAHIESKSGAFCDIPDIKTLRSLGYHVDDEPRVRRALANLDSNTAAQCINYFKTERLSAFDNIEWLDILLSTFQTADSSRREFLRYYSQQEWRLVHFFSPDVVTLALNDNKNHGLHPDLQARRKEAKKWYRKFRRQFSIKCTPGQLYLLAGKRIRRRDGQNPLCSKITPFADFIDEVVLPKAIAKNRKLTQYLFHDHDQFAESWDSGDSVVYNRTTAPMSQNSEQ